MKSIKKALFTFILFVLGLPNLCILNIALAQNNPYDAVLKVTIDDPKSTVAGSLEDAISTNVDKGNKGVTLFTEQIKSLIGYAIDVFIVIGIAMAFLGGYKVMTSNAEDKMKEGLRLVIFGVLGIIIMVSARFLAESLVGTTGIISGEFPKSSETDPNGIILAKKLYDNIMFPFIKVALYLVVGALFFIMATKVITFVISTEEAAKKKAGGIILWCVVGIFIILGSKQIVEAVMGEQDVVLKESATWIEGGEGGMGNHLEKFNSIQLISQIINWVMGLTMFVIVVLIIIQGYRMFTKPDDPKNRERLKKTLLYVIIGVLVIGASYVISNVLVLNGLDSIQGG